jgi:DNA-binding CsgD family transcriptional regulator
MTPIELNHLTRADAGALLRLAAEAGELPAQPLARRVHIVEGLRQIVGGATGLLVELDGASGRPIDDSLLLVNSCPTCDPYVRASFLRGESPDPVAPALDLAGRSHVALLRAAAVKDRLWYGSNHYQYIRRPTGIDESLYSCAAMPNGSAIVLCIQREAGASAFTESNRQALDFFQAHAASLFAPASPISCLEHPLVAPLSRRLKQVALRLLKGDSEKQIAVALKLSPHTVHDYVKDLYRLHRVNSRGEFLALFVNA